MNYNCEDLVRKYVNFHHGVDGKGWNRVYCEFCGDGSRKKGPRGGWLFTDGGDTCFYHCFNSGCAGNFSTNREHHFSKDMRGIFDAFGIPQSEYNGLLLNRGTNKVKQTTAPISYTTLEMPDHFQPLIDMSTQDAKDAKTFLRANYALSCSNYSFYLATGETASTVMIDKADAAKLRGRLVIPYFKNGKLIYYQARDITGKAKQKYISPEVPKNNILFNIDQLYRSTDAPLYVVEGAQDAIHLNGVGTLGNELTSQQIAILTSSKRRKILVPDFNGDSHKMLEQFVDIGWDVALPTYKNKFKDVSEAVVNYGKLYTAYDIATNILPARTAKMMMTYLNRT